MEQKSDRAELVCPTSCWPPCAGTTVHIVPLMLKRYIGNPTRRQQRAGPNNPTWCESVHWARSAQFAAEKNGLKRVQKRRNPPDFTQLGERFSSLSTFVSRLTGPSSRPLVLSLTVCRLKSWIIMSSSFLRSTWQWCLVNTHPLLQYLHIVHM